jgi:hypothetical protein
MKTTKGTKKLYDREFKMDAARLVVDDGRSVAVRLGPKYALNAPHEFWPVAHQPSFPQLST